MLPAGHRIRKSKEFDLIRSEGSKYKTDHFMFVMRTVKKEDKNPTYLYPRFGFIVSKKIGKAVVRNQVKRWLREAVRVELDNFPKDAEVTIVAFEGAEKSNFEELHTELKELIPSLK